MVTRVVPDKNKLAIRDLFGIDPEYLLSDSNIYTRTLQDTPVEERTGILPLITTPEREGGGEGGTRTGIDSLEPTFTRDGLDDSETFGGIVGQELIDRSKMPAQRFDLGNFPFEGPVQSGFQTIGYRDDGSPIRDFRSNQLADSGVALRYRTPRTIGDQVYAASQSGGLGTIVPSLYERAISSIRGAFQPKVQGTLGDRLKRQYDFARGIPSPIGILAAARSPFNPASPTYNKNLPAQLNALEAMGPGFIGRDPGTGGLKYGPKSVLAGKNVISGFGFNSPELALKDYIEKMSKNKKVTEAYRKKQLKKAKEELAKTTGGDGGGGAKTKSKSKSKSYSRSYNPGAGGVVEHGGGGGEKGGGSGSGGSLSGGGFCFDPNTLVQMADGTEKKIKEIQLGDNTKGGEVTGVFQFKAADEIHDYKGVTVAGSHYVKENGRFIMVQDSPLSVKIDKIPVVYSLDTTGRRIFIKDIEFADYNGDGIAKGFLANAGVDLNGFDKEVLRQVENRLI